MSICREGALALARLIQPENHQVLLSIQSLLGFLLRSSYFLSPKTICLELLYLSAEPPQVLFTRVIFSYI